MFKKNFVILILLLTTIDVAYSQFKIHYGIKVGAIFSHQSTSSFEGEYTTTGTWNAGGGVFLEGSFNDDLAAIAEMNYVKEGWKNDKVYVLSMPLMIKFKTKLGKYTPTMFLGPRIDFALNVNTSDNVYYDEGKLIMGITLGLGCEKNIWKDHSVLAEVRYNYDIGNLYIHEEREFEYYINYYANRSLSFLIGFKF